ncbi:hypothetical protein ElyMa_001341400 [Elysia marginata]|uniref:Uncharacterized protein n=1 Tax=Elysia marginata TaxID=1093978 RepID=A0AAV4IPL6_9GAST|nr:hypothetical protein ElyMa_001341400 [Elysia marginata]
MYWPSSQDDTITSDQSVPKIFSLSIRFDVKAMTLLQEGEDCYSTTAPEHHESVLIHSPALPIPVDPVSCSGSLVLPTWTDAIMSGRNALVCS